MFGMRECMQRKSRAEYLPRGSKFAPRSSGEGSTLYSAGALIWQHEPCWHAVRKGQAAHWRGDRTQSTVWDVPNANPTVDPGKRIKPSTALESPSS
jgi:hypothetical protein